MSDTEEQVYPSKVDWWIGAIMILAPLIHLPLGVWVITQGQTMLGVGLIFWGFIIGGIITSLTWPCQYTLTGSKLIIRSGLMTDPIGYSKIVSIEESGSWMSAPALSLDRVKIELKDGSHRLISPEKKEEFIEKVRRSIESKGES